MVRALLAGVALLAAGALAGRGGGWLVEERSPSPFRHSVPAGGMIDAKLRFFDAHRDDYTILFIGSSRLYRAVVPPLLDAELEKRGFHERSFNLGAAWMSLAEARVILSELLARRPARLRYLVLDERCLTFWDDNLDTERHDYWHTVEETWLATGAIVRGEWPLAKKARQVGNAWRAALRRQLKSGRVVDWLWRALDPPRPEDQYQVVDGGYEPLDDAVRKAEFLQNLDEYWLRVNRLRSPPNPVDPYYALMIERIRTLAREHGAELVLFSGPAPWRPDQVSGPGAPPALRFDDPDAYGALFDPALHGDAGHLNDAGARRLAPLLAERFAALLQGR